MHRDRRVERMSRCTCVPPAAARPMMAALKDGWAPRNGTDAVIGRHARQAAPRRHAANMCPSGCTAPALELDPLAVVRASRVPHARRARVRLPAPLGLGRPQREALPARRSRGPRAARACPVAHAQSQSARAFVAALRRLPLLRGGGCIEAACPDTPIGLYQQRQGRHR